MKPFSRGSLGILIAVTAVLLVLVFVFILFFRGSTDGTSGGIILPDPSVSAPPVQVPEQSASGEFVQISPDNVLQVLWSFSRAGSYYQKYTVSVGTEDVQSTKSVELWVNVPYLHAEISDGRSVKSLVSDTETLHIWYGDDPESISVPLGEDLTLEDALGLLTYEYLLSTDPDTITEAEYLVLNQTQPIQCIFVSCAETESVVYKYWINLSNGLLYQAEVYRDNELVYTLSQKSYVALGSDDSAFSDRFLLPNGTALFRKETETQLR